MEKIGKHSLRLILKGGANELSLKRENLTSVYVMPMT
jgi:hypothetical protein